MEAKRVKFLFIEYMIVKLHNFKKAQFLLLLSTN